MVMLTGSVVSHLMGTGQEVRLKPRAQEGSEMDRGIGDGLSVGGEGY